MCNHEHTRYKYLKQNNNRLILSVRCSGILTIIRLHLIGWFMVFNAPFNNISAISRSVCIWKTIWKYQSCKNKMTVQRKYITMTTWRCGAIFWLSTCLVNVIPEARRAPTLDIYVYLTIAVSLSLLVDYWTPRVSSDHESVLRHRCVITSTGGLLDTEGIIRPWVSASPSLCHYLYRWTIGHRGYHPTMSQCFGIDIVY